MSTSNAAVERSIATDDQFDEYDDVDVPDEETRHSREDAIESKTFEFMAEATYHMDDYKGLQARFVLFMAGRLGMRAGEIAHMDESWIDWRRSMICIPRRDACDIGRNGTICGDCRGNAEQKADTRTENRYAEAHGQLGTEDILEPGGGTAANAVVPEELFYDAFWAGKTDAAAREIPFDAVTRAGIVVDRFFERFDRWPLSQTGVNRRVKTMAEYSQGIEPEDIYPHALRATGATYWADHGLNAHSLKGLMGWAQLSTARNYIQDSSVRTAKAMRDATI